MARSVLLTACLLLVSYPLAGATAKQTADFTAKYCTGCHNGTAKLGGLDLTTLAFDAANPANFAEWVKVHDRVRAGEMPPKTIRKRPDPAEQQNFVQALAASLNSAERQTTATAGRVTERRLNAYEYENALRDLFYAP